MHPKLTNRETGFFGEKLAEDHLVALGYKILDRNWRYSRSEIDLIAMHEKILVFIEVKTRAYDYFGPPESFVSDQKELLMYEAASVYMDKINHDWEFRFDIVAIILNKSGNHKIEHFPDAF
jgi:putative endonuclease